jgi:L-malate glycosyltransferase
MKILHTVESYYPEIGGMPEVVKQLSERLAAMGHDITVATKKCIDRKSDVIKNVKIRSFAVDGNDVRGITGDVEGYRNFLLNSDFDIVTNFAAQQWATDIAMPILSKIKGRKVNVPTGFSGLYWSAYKDYYRKMETLMKEYDMNVFLSNDYRDINFARANGITKNIIIPNGAAGDEFLPESSIDIRSKLGISKDDFFILHVGSYTGIKGHVEALKMYLKSKIQNGILVFVGFHNSDFERFTKFSKKYILWKIINLFPAKRYIITMLSREETVAAYKAANLLLFPSNMECSPIVLFESMASKTPFLATNVGNSVEITEWSGGGEILPTLIDKEGFSHPQMQGSIAMLNNLYANENRRNQLALNGFNAWKKKFSWEVIAKSYEEMYSNLLNQPGK